MKPSEEAIHRAAKVPYGTLSTRLQAAYDVDFPELHEIEVGFPMSFGGFYFEPGYVYHVIRIEPANPTPDVDLGPTRTDLSWVPNEDIEFHEADLEQPHGEDPRDE